MLNIWRKALHLDSLAPQDYFLGSVTKSDCLLSDIVFFVDNSFSCCRTVNNCPVSLIHSLGVIWFLSNGAIILLKTVIIVAFPEQSRKLCFYFHTTRICCYYFHPEDLLLLSPSKGFLLLLPRFVVIFTPKICYCCHCLFSLFSLFISYQVSTSAFFSFVRPTFFVKDIWNILTKDISKLSKLSETFWQKVYQSYQSYLKHFDKRYIKVIKVIWNIVTKDISMETKSKQPALFEITLQIK